MLNDDYEGLIRIYALCEDKETFVRTDFDDNFDWIIPTEVDNQYLLTNYGIVFLYDFQANRVLHSYSTNEESVDGLRLLPGKKFSFWTEHELSLLHF
jgi:hypothetical protein